ncbi:uncharacterized protein BX663DRAFT_520966 [Cokeromyces recurvatus]|uniref:uncharacterized protein n=1 Tax=Cokeromyces recurvatus TaxID=90255 RepID=UPI002220A35E|nr:uncharacterized protein BX663DRAFT_520966 [Cokeromyces recurvatus]KAI7899452.1 hypothetical protein BX663DRAFT_520966 [Cokeromyces recurvatus]
MNNTTAFYSQNIFASPLSDYNPFDTSLFDTARKIEGYPFYPSPIESPNNDLLLLTPECNFQEQGLLNMMMVPPLDMPSFMAPTSFEEIPSIDLVDQFIAEHEAALNNFNLKHVMKQEESPPEEMMIIKTNKPRRGRGRGRGKGIKNKISKKEVVSTERNKKTPVEGALYVCQHDNCGRSFTRPYNLTSHMKTHTTERPYACSHCGRRFARQHDRNRHEKLHWGIRPYACHHCHKSFARMDALNRHLRMENGCTASVHL